MTTMPPAEMAQLDQEVAEVQERLDHLIGAYLYGCKADPELTREETIAAMAAPIVDVTTHKACAELLCCAIERLSHSR